MFVCNNFIKFPIRALLNVVVTKSNAWVEMDNEVICGDKYFHKIGLKELKNFLELRKREIEAEKNSKPIEKNRLQNLEQELKFIEKRLKGL